MIPRSALYVVGLWSALTLEANLHAAELPGITAHRGASYDAPENTLAAFRLAWDLGADAVEGDFYLTKDKQIVCIHDADTKRTSSQKLVVQDSLLEELQKLEYGTWKAPRFAGEKLPTLSDVLAVIPAGKTFVIELKSKVAIVPFLVNELKLAHRSDIGIMIISFDAATITKCKQMMPEYPAHWLTGFKKSATGLLAPTAKKISRTVQQCGADGVGIEAKREQVTAKFVADLKAGGCREFHVWTVDTPEDAKYFRDLGAMMITTNRPDLIRQSFTP
jgi:glycerophosphoryl diester phosphodiesterase